jgi:hypothetical protein
MLCCELKLRLLRSPVLRLTAEAGKTKSGQVLLKLGGQRGPDGDSTLFITFDTLQHSAPRAKNEKQKSATGS